MTPRHWAGIHPRTLIRRQTEEGKRPSASHLTASWPILAKSWKTRDGGDWSRDLWSFTGQLISSHTHMQYDVCQSPNCLLSFLKCVELAQSSILTTADIWSAAAASWVWERNKKKVLFLCSNSLLPTSFWVPLLSSPSDADKIAAKNETDQVCLSVSADKRVWALREAGKDWSLINLIRLQAKPWWPIFSVKGGIRCFDWPPHPIDNGCKMTNHHCVDISKSVTIMGWQVVCNQLLSSM